MNMVTRILTVVFLFAVACVVFISSSGASAEVKASVIGSWLVVVAAFGAALWWPGLRKAIRLLLITLTLITGAWFLTYVAARVVGNYEMSVRAVTAYLMAETVLVLSLFGLTRIIERIYSRVHGNRT